MTATTRTPASTRRGPTRCVLVSVRVPGVSEAEADGSLAELTRLVDTLGWKVVATLIQHRSNLKSAMVVGEGKLKELAGITGGSGRVASPVRRKVSKAELRRREESTAASGFDEDEGPPAVEDPEGSDAGPSETPAEKAEVVIFDCELAPAQMQKVESATGVPVLDRTGIIIEIFHRHARTRAAKLQVELARLAYVAPQLRETGGSADRAGGGIGGKGAGESKLELDRRRIRDRMRELRQQLEEVATVDDQRRERRASELTVALVGYTNAGKSSLMRALTGSEVLVEDKLFATLDTTVRPLVPASAPRVLISDTVGFIRKLPHDLVASFRSTLQEAAHAALVAYVVDSSDPEFHQQLEVTRTVLAEVGASELPSLLVLNKIDLVSEDQRESLREEYPEAHQVSALDPESVARLRERFLAHFEEGMVQRSLFVPFAAAGIAAAIREAARVLEEQYSAEGMTLTVRGHPGTLDALERRLRGA